jgi:hypothetical protein
LRFGDAFLKPDWSTGVKTLGLTSASHTWQWCIVTSLKEFHEICLVLLSRVNTHDLVFDWIWQQKHLDDVTFYEKVAFRELCDG